MNLLPCLDTASQCVAANMAAISDLVAASAALHDRVDLSDQELDYKLRDHVAYLRRSISSKALQSVAHDEAFLDVSNCFLQLL